MKIKLFENERMNNMKNEKYEEKGTMSRDTVKKKSAEMIGSGVGGAGGSRPRSQSQSHPQSHHPQSLSHSFRGGNDQEETAEEKEAKWQKKVKVRESFRRDSWRWEGIVAKIFIVLWILCDGANTKCGRSARIS
jgi:hypothetical protein